MQAFWGCKSQKQNGHLPKFWELDQTFDKYFCEKLLLFVTDLHWRDIVSIEYILGMRFVTRYADLFGMPLWVNNILRLRKKKQWLENGVVLVGIILGAKGDTLEVEYLQALLAVKM